MEHITENTLEASHFDKELKKYMEKEFKDWPMKGDRRLYIKTIFWLLALIFCYDQAVFIQTTFLGRLGWFIGMGVSISGIGMCIMHDASHRAYSKIKWVNESLGFTMNIVGSCVKFWETKHNEAHHYSPNIAPIDDDIEMGPLFRVDPNKPLWHIHKYQFLYAWPLYSLLTILWVTLFDFKKYFTQKVGPTKIKGFDWSEHIIFWTTKVWVGFVFIYLPYHYGGSSALWGVCIAYGVSGLILASIFQCAHVLAFLPIEHRDKYKKESNQRHQLRTSADFNSDTILGRILSWYCGGLDFQTVHHLFPQVSHVHYRNMQRKIMKFVDHYNNKYKDTIYYYKVDSFSHALWHHVNKLYIEGRK